VVKPTVGTRLAGLRQDADAPVASSDVAGRPADLGDVAPDPSARRRLRAGPATVAVLTWLVLTPLGAVLVNRADLNPLTYRGALLPLAAGGLAVLGFGLLALRWPGERLAGAAAGGTAAWAALCLFAATHGTPYAESGLRGDTGRLTAMITRYTDTWRPVDGFVPTVPTEYPPLFPWLLARVATLTDTPAWTLLNDGFAIGMGLAILGSFLLWQRITPAWVALVLSVAAPVAFSQPRKTYEILVLGLLAPWALTALARFGRRGGLHWLPAGFVLGVMVQTYQGFLLFSALGLVAMAVLGWRGSADRAGYLRHVALVVAVAAVVSAWYVVPFLYGAVALAGSRINDLYVAGEIRSDPVGVLMFAGGMLGPVKLLGLAGLLLLCRRRWWAQGLLLIVASAYVYRWVYLAVFVATGHTGYLDYTSRLIGTVLLCSAVLTVWTVAPELARRVGRRLPKVATGGGVVLALAASMAVTWRIWMPMPAGLAELPGQPPIQPNLAAYAHAEPLPNGRHPRFQTPASMSIAWFPVRRIEDAVTAQLGPDARPLTVSYSEKLFAFLPWPAYVAVEPQASNTFSRWGDRVAELNRLAALPDPETFARESANSRFGRIDVFVLRAIGDDWRWTNVTFRPALFDPAHWRVSVLANRTVLAVRVR
jgi:hypothetical protein